VVWWVGVLVWFGSEALEQREKERMTRTKNLDDKNKTPLQKEKPPDLRHHKRIHKKSRTEKLTAKKEKRERKGETGGDFTVLF